MQKLDTGLLHRLYGHRIGGLFLKCLQIWLPFSIYSNIYKSPGLNLCKSRVSNMCKSSASSPASNFYKSPVSNLCNSLILTLIYVFGIPPSRHRRSK
ncbi:hypothetical protein CDAR_491101 [Caerostris darwini]|uniref:Uncharacterized protein n=1 Tax=Caerostris darwini TaxID=1538125 RepID=A0AAV4X6U3_9ARAC|nr:hypothetical protein CDAR_491101 [Caerostris darwini]